MTTVRFIHLSSVVLPKYFSYKMFVKQAVVANHKKLRISYANHFATLKTCQTKQILKSFASKCWKCGRDLKQHNLFCVECGSVQKVNIEQLNLYDVFNIKSEFAIDLKNLDNSFKSIQLKLHPDKFANCSKLEQESSLASSSAVNQAYQILKNPLSRAEYLCDLLFHVKIIDGQTTTKSDSQLMSEVFDLRETISESSDRMELTAMRDDLVTHLDDLQKRFIGCISAMDAGQSESVVVRLRYYYKMLEEVDEKVDKLC